VDFTSHVIERVLPASRDVLTRGLPKGGPFDGGSGDGHDHPLPKGFQIAFLILALLFLAAPAEKYLFNEWTWLERMEFP
jgi:hypothetical protein